MTESRFPARLVVEFSGRGPKAPARIRVRCRCGRGCDQDSASAKRFPTTLSRVICCAASPGGPPAPQHLFIVCRYTLGVGWRTLASATG
eukprot:6111505-Alexandrium_andersonii.AAC.1